MSDSDDKPKTTLTTESKSKIYTKIKAHVNTIIAIVTVATLIVNVIALSIIAGTVEDNNTIIKNLHGQLILERAKLVKDYLDFEQKFSITISSFDPEKTRYTIPIDFTNLAKYRTEGSVWVMAGDFCIDQNSVRIEQNRTYGQGFDIEPTQSRTMNIQIPDDITSQFDTIDSFIVKISIDSYPYDSSVGPIDELEKHRFIWIKFNHEITTNQLYPQHVSDEKIDCADLDYSNENITIPYDHELVYTKHISRMAKI